MTLRDALGVDARHVYRRVDEILNSEDGMILLVDRRPPPPTCKGLLYLLAKSSKPL